MSERVKRYWNQRLRRWGDLEMSGRSYAGTNWWRLMNGAPQVIDERDNVHDFSEETETGLFVGLLAPEERDMARAAYTSGQVTAAGFKLREAMFLARCAHKLERLRLQRLNGEALDPTMRKRKPRIGRVKIDHRVVAATAMDE